MRWNDKTYLLIAKFFFAVAAVAIAVASCGKTNSGGASAGGNGGTTGATCTPQTFGSCNSCGTPFGAGAGTPSNPYQICSVQHILNMAQAAYSANSFVLATDIDGCAADSNGNCTVNNFQTVWQTTSAFSFDGQNHAINNWQGAAPLFGYNGGTIQNLLVNSANVQASCRGGLVGTNTSTGVVKNITVTNMTMSASCSTGAIIGINQGSLTTSTVTGLTLTSRTNDSDTLGGAVGWNTQSGTISQVLVQNSTISTAQAWDVGGFVGSNTGSIQQCAAQNVNITAWGNIGGFVGCGGDTAQTPSNGNFCQQEYQYPPPLPSQNPRIQTSYAIGGTINGVKNSFFGNPGSIGGFVGQNIADTITNCYTTVQISGGTGSSVIGGFVGTGGCDSSTNPNDANCATPTGSPMNNVFVGAPVSGSVIGVSQVGGFVGYAAQGSYLNAYWDGNEGPTATAGALGPSGSTSGITQETHAFMLSGGSSPAVQYPGFSFPPWTAPTGTAFATLPAP